MLLTLSHLRNVPGKGPFPPELHHLMVFFGTRGPFNDRLLLKKSL